MGRVVSLATLALACSLRIVMLAAGVPEQAAKRSALSYSVSEWTLKDDRSTELLGEASVLASRSAQRVTWRVPRPGKTQDEVDLTLADGNELVMRPAQHAFHRIRATDIWRTLGPDDTRPRSEVKPLGAGTVAKFPCEWSAFTWKWEIELPDVRLIPAALEGKFCVGTNRFDEFGKMLNPVVFDILEPFDLGTLARSGGLILAFEISDGHGGLRVALDAVTTGQFDESLFSVSADLVEGPEVRRQPIIIR